MAAFLTYERTTIMTARAMSLGSEAQSDAKAPMANAAMITEVPWIESSNWQPPSSELPQTETTSATDDLDAQSLSSMS